MAKKKKKTQTQILLTKTQKEKKSPNHTDYGSVMHPGVVHGGSVTGEVLDRLIVARLVGDDFLRSYFLGLVLAVVAWVSFQLRGT